MNFESIEHPPIMISGLWEETRRRWEKEGLPKNCGQDGLYGYFGIEPFRTQHIKADTLMLPPFNEKIISENTEYIIKINKDGVTEKNFRDGSSMPEFIEYPVKTSEDISWLKEKLNPENPDRISKDWLGQAQAGQKEGVLQLCNGGMYFAFLNEHMGTERLLLEYYDHPEFIQAVNDLQCACCEKVLRTVLPELKLDFIGYHEDMAFKTGPLISPDLFRETMTPYYKRITAITEKYGVNLHYMDSDGDITRLIPLWLDCGISIMSPLERAAGMDPVLLRKEYGKSLSMIGGFDKRILAAGKTEIKKEMKRLEPVISSGGFIPACDHSVPPDVSLENYRYFIECQKVLYGV